MYASYLQPRCRVEDVDHVHRERGLTREPGVYMWNVPVAKQRQQLEKERTHLTEIQQHAQKMAQKLDEMFAWVARTM